MNKYILIAASGLMILMSACQQKAPVTPNHLIMLTESSDDIADATFLPIDDLENCEARAAAAMKVFPMAGIKYIAHYCVNTDATFGPFLHNPEPTGPKYYFGLDFAEDGMVLSKITPYASKNACGEVKSDVCVVAYQNTQ